MKACTLCLQTNINVCQLGNSAAVNFIQEIFVNNGYQKLSCHNYICFLCKYLLNKSYDFIQKTLRAQKALKEKIEAGSKITLATLLQIDRRKLDLDLNLIHQVNSINYHLWDSNNNDEPSTKICPSDSINETYDMLCTVKTEGYGSETVLTPLNCYENKYQDDINYNDGDVENSNDDNFEIKQEHIHIDTEPILSEAHITKLRSGRTYANKQYVSNYKAKDKTIKTKCKLNQESDEDELSDPFPAIPERKRKPKVKKRKKLKVDTRKYPMKCDHCKYMIQNKTEHFHHYLLYHQGIQYPYGREGKYMCQHCGIVKTSAHVLHQHELTHGEKKMACAQCGKLFHNDTRLKRHQLRHGAVLLTCDYCNKGFFARTELILHIRTHTGVKPFKCVLCDAAFAHRGNVAIHMRSRHRHQPPAAPAKL